MMEHRKQGYIPPKIKSNFESYRKKWYLLKQDHSKFSQSETQSSHDSIRERFGDLVSGNRIIIINDCSVTGVYRSRLQEAMELSPLLRIRSDLKRSRKDMQMRQQKKLLTELYASNRKKQLAFLNEMQTKSNTLPLSLVLFDQSVSENRDEGEKKLLTDNQLLSIQEPELKQIPLSRMA